MPELLKRAAAPVRVFVAHRDLAGLLGCDLLLGLAFSFASPFMSLFGEHEVGMDSRAFGLFMTVTSLSGIVICTLLARASDTRLSRRAVLLLGSGAGALGYLGYALLRNPVWLALVGSTFLGVAGISFSQLFAQARELLARSDVPPEDTPLYMNIFRLFFALAWTVGPALASLVVARFSYAGIFVASAICYGSLFVAVVFLVPARRPTLESRSETSLRQTARALARGEVLAPFLGFVMIFACGSMASISLPLLVVETLGGGSRDVGIVYSVSPFFELPLMLFFGAMASKGGGRHSALIRLGFLLTVVYYAGLSVVRAPWHIYPLQVISAAITAITQGLSISFFQDFLPDQAGTATNLYSNASSLGRVAGYLLFSQLAAVLAYRGIFLACSGICLAALALMWVFRPSGTRRSQGKPRRHGDTEGEATTQ
jgi:SET family sugar efflux transporter-like MFS transporter